MKTALADSFMAIFGFKRIATQDGNVITPVFIPEVCGDCRNLLTHTESNYFWNQCGKCHREKHAAKEAGFK